MLVVEDEGAIRSLVQHSLEELGYTVLSAEHGAQAVELFERSGDEIVLVLLDLMMPVMDGAETARALHTRRPGVPILIMSGIGDHAPLRDLHDVRIAGFVPKPFAPDQLAQAVAVARRGTAAWAGKDRRDEQDPQYAGPERRAPSET